MKTVYINKNGNITKWKIRRIAKKVNKLNKKEETAVVLSKNLYEIQELVDEIEKYEVKILNRKMDF